MGMPQTARVWTRQDVLALPDDGKRYELVDGELLVSASPTYPHQYAVGGLYRRIWPFVEDQRLGDTLMSPADLDLLGGQLLQPDLFILPPNPQGKARLEWSEAGIPILAVEVLSPSTARYDRITKRSRYQRSGIAEFWIVDIDARLIERWRPADARPELLVETIAWHPAGATEPLEIDLTRFFREVWRER